MLSTVLINCMYKINQKPVNIKPKTIFLGRGNMEKVLSEVPTAFWIYLECFLLFITFLDMKANWIYHSNTARTGVIAITAMFLIYHLGLLGFKTQLLLLLIGGVAVDYNLHIFFFRFVMLPVAFLLFTIFFTYCSLFVICLKEPILDSLIINPIKGFVNYLNSIEKGLLS